MPTSRLASISSTISLISPTHTTTVEPHTTQSTAPASPTSSKPPSVLRYTLILLKARPTPSDISTISAYSTTRSAGSTPPSTPIAPCEAASTLDHRDEEWRGGHGVGKPDKDTRVESTTPQWNGEGSATPPPPYQP